MTFVYACTRVHTRQAHKHNPLHAAQALNHPLLILPLPDTFLVPLLTLTLSHSLPSTSSHTHLVVSTLSPTPTGGISPCCVPPPYTLSHTFYSFRYQRSRDLHMQAMHGQDSTHKNREAGSSYSLAIIAGDMPPLLRGCSSATPVQVKRHMQRVCVCVCVCVCDMPPMLRGSFATPVQVKRHMQCVCVCVYMCVCVCVTCHLCSGAP